MSKTPKLRTTKRAVPPYELNKFPAEFLYNLGEQVVYVLATRGVTDIEGKEWEAVFARSLGVRDWGFLANNIEDVVLGNTAWGTKSIKSKKPSKETSVPLISGRNDINYSFDYTSIHDQDPNKIGEDVLAIWNERLSIARKDYKHLRTAVLIRSYDLTELVIFEFDMIRFEHELFEWKWNKRKNLEGFDKKTGVHRFTWQPGGKQFTIQEQVPEERTIINIKMPDLVPKEYVLDKIGFDKSWITVTKVKATKGGSRGGPLPTS